MLLQKLEEAVGCHWTVGPAMQALSQVYQATSGGTPGHPPGGARINPEVLQRWARVLLQPSVDRVGLACDLLEQAAYARALAGPTITPLDAGDSSGRSSFVLSGILPACRAMWLLSAPCLIITHSAWKFSRIS